MFPAEFKRGTAPQGNPSTIAKTAEAAANHSAVTSFTNRSRTPRRIAHSCLGAVEILEKLAVAMFLWGRCKIWAAMFPAEFKRGTAPQGNPSTIAKTAEAALGGSKSFSRCKLHEPFANAAKNSSFVSGRCRDSREAGRCCDVPMEPLQASRSRTPRRIHSCPLQASRTHNGEAGYWMNWLLKC